MAHQYAYPASPHTVRDILIRASHIVPEPPHPHPAAPAEFKESFSSFLAKFQESASRAPASVATPKSGAKAGPNTQVVEEFWDMPQRLRSPAMTEAEMEAITSGGASLF
ncbi:hypothetical protein EIP86_001725 [Pleurotus ostreatoroseus]|nr:hypothetical protein EIP86_001725 [Pleurotus ostreatoroseus]